jgi:hypothetical protein
LLLQLTERNFEQKIVILSSPTKNSLTTQTPDKLKVLIRVGTIKLPCGTMLNEGKIFYGFLKAQNEKKEKKFDL